MPTVTGLTRDEFLAKFDGLRVVPFFEPDPESLSSGPERGRVMDAQACWEAITEGRWATEVPTDADEQRVIELVTDSIDCISLVTEAEMKKRQQQEERQELESYVARVARNANADPKDTSAVLDALQRVIDGAENDLEGAREDGLCIGFGATPETWQDHCDGIRERGNEARRAIDWLAANAPLAYAAWAERE